MLVRFGRIGTKSELIDQSGSPTRNCGVTLNMISAKFGSCMVGPGSLGVFMRRVRVRFVFSDRSSLPEVSGPGDVSHFKATFELLSKNITIPELLSPGAEDYASFKIIARYFWTRVRVTY